ncbi:serine hydrolase domain-containing protein [Roseivirga seohaensis]|nr:serine hydrolase domain-containing protein [Roseivirga seohaensis]
MMLRRFFYSFLTFVILVQTGRTQGIDTTRLSEYFDTLAANNKFMGSVALLKEGQIIYTKQVGFAELETKKEPNNNTKYRIGSVSKLFTATLIFKAIEEGKVSLNETIYNYFPSIENSEQITISNLLNHRSGIHNYTDDKDEFLSYHTNSKTKTEMVALIAQGGSDFVPNTKAAYSNSNYVLLSYILEEVFQSSFSTVLKEHITEPLHLVNTFFGTPININNNESYAYTLGREWMKMDETHSSIDLGAGGITSTPTDLVLFAHALFNHKILSEQSLETMKTIQDGFGMGLFKTLYYNKVSYGHNGEIDGFQTALRYFEDSKYAFAITANAMDYSLNLISVTIVNALFNQHFDIPDFRTYNPKPSDLNQYVGVYSSETFPVELMVIKRGKQLEIQATGDSKMNLQATAKGEFKYDLAGIQIKFIPEKGQMILKQGGKVSTLTKAN